MATPASLSNSTLANTRKKPELNVKKIVGRFQETLWNAIREKPYHVLKTEQTEVYKRLMNHLDEIEKKHGKQWKYWKRAVAVAVFWGLTAALVYSLTVEPTKHKRLLRQRVWQWIAMAMMLTAVFSVVPFLTYLLSWPFKRYCRTHKYAVYLIRQMKRSLDVTLWFCLMLLGWYAWFRPRLKHVHGDVSVIVVSQVTRLLIALCIGSLLWTLKNGVYLKLEADLHYDQLFDRISQTVVYLNSLLVLDRPRRLLRNNKDWADFLVYSNDISKEEGNYTLMTKLRKMVTPNGVITKEEVINYDNPNYYIFWMDVKKMDRKTVPIWILRRLSEEYLNEVKFLRPHNADELLKDDEALLKEANEMFHRIVGPNNESEIRREHLSKVEYGLSEKELDELFHRKLHEGGDENNTKQDGKVNNITQEEEESADKAIDADKFLNWLVRAHKNCWSLERTLESSKIAFVKLNWMLSSFLVVLVAIIWLLLSKIVNTAQLALLFAPFLAASFMFENSSKNMFQGIIFAFAMHPFDVGDRVIIEETEMRVKVLNILTSVFVKYDTGAEVIYPNSKLAITKIVNLDITPDQSDKLEFIINGSDTPLEDIKDLELKIQKLLDDNRCYASGTKVVKSTYPENNEDLKMTVHFKYLVSYLPAEIKASRRSEILTMIMKLCMEMKANKKVYPLEYVPFDLEFTAPKNDKMDGIERFKRKLLRSLKEEGYEYCKVVMKQEDRVENQIIYLMALFVSKSEEDKYPKDAHCITVELIKKRFFNQVDNLLPEWGYTKLTVSRDEQSIYPDTNWANVFGGVSFEGRQGNLIAAAAEQARAEAAADSKEGVQENQKQTR